MNITVYLAMIGSPWGCDACKYKCGHRLVVDRLDSLETKIKATMHEAGARELMTKLEKEDLHPNHFLMFCLKERILFTRYQVGTF